MHFHSLPPVGNLSILADDPKPQNPPPTVRLLSVPKSGTHLLEKLLRLLGFPESKIGPPHHAFYFEEAFAVKLDHKNIVQIRDPRDVLVSLVHQVDRVVRFNLEENIHNKGTFIGYNQTQKMKEWKLKSFDEKLMDAITHNNQTGYDFIWANKKQWEAVVEYFPLTETNPDHFLMTSFEDLVGEKGGGSDVLQRNTIKRIAKFCSLEQTEEKIDQLQRDLFGNSFTFRKGQIGTWKNHFKPEHVKAFLPWHQKYLEFFGYEKDDTWAKPYLDAS